VSGGFLYLAFRNVKLDELGVALGRINGHWLIAPRDHVAGIIRRYRPSLYRNSALRVNQDAEIRSPASRAAALVRRVATQPPRRPGAI